MHGCYLSLAENRLTKATKVLSRFPRELKARLQHRLPARRGLFFIPPVLLEPYPRLPPVPDPALADVGFLVPVTDFEMTRNTGIKFDLNIVTEFQQFY